jgi:competence protein ComEA
VQPPAALPFPAPPPPDPALQLTWPRSAQWAAVALVTIAAVLLLVNAAGYLQSGARPTELLRGKGLSFRIDLNRASHAELLLLPGVGKNLAERIEQYRTDKGGFGSVDDLRRVSGIGPAMLQRLRPWVCVGTEESEEDEAPAERLPLPAVKPATKTLSKREAALKGVIIDVNRAPLAELQRLPGIGPKMSRRIVEARNKRPFASVDDLRRVRGIGPKTLARLRPYVAVGPEPVRTVLKE